jgi:hypothetical protein
MAAELMMASWESIARRSLMMLSGHMLSRGIPAHGNGKGRSDAAFGFGYDAGRGKRQALAPWHKRATANAKRLRRKS